MTTSGGATSEVLGPSEVLGRALVLARDAPDPLHVQIADYMRTLIHRGIWPPHFRVPPEVSLAREFDVARGTLKKALRTLVDGGLLVQVQGRGTFVTSGGVMEAVEHESLSLDDSLTVQGIESKTSVLSHSQIAPPTRVAGLLDLPDPRAPLTLLKRVRYAASSPVGYFINYIRTDLCPDFTDEELAQQSLYRLIEQAVGLQIAYGRRTFESRGAEADLAELLEVPLGFPILYFEQVTNLEDGRPVEYSQVWVRSDRVRVTSSVARHVDSNAKPISH